MTSLRDARKRRPKTLTRVQITVPARTQTTSMESVTPPPALGECFIAGMIRYLHDTLGVEPLFRDEEGIDYDIADGRFTLFFALPACTRSPLGTRSPHQKPAEAPEACVKFITDKLKAAGWDIHWPKWDDDSDDDSDGENDLKHVLEISLSIDDMHRSAEAAIVRARDEFIKETSFE